MTKLRATIIHFCASILIVAIMMFVMTVIWYPPPLFRILGGFGLLLLIAAVDVVLGPLLTFVVFKPHKIGLKFDLCVIVVCQLAALIYGIYTIAQVRPAFIVFVKDRFELVRALDPTTEGYAEASLKSQFDSAPWLGPQLVGVAFPASNDEIMKITESAMNGGADIQHYPKYYVGIDGSKPQIIQKAQSLEVLKKLNPNDVGRIDKLAGELGVQSVDLGFIVYRAIRADISMIVNRRNGTIYKAEALLPW